MVDDKEVLKELSHCKEQASSFIADAALAIVVMADPLASDVWIEDASIASIMIPVSYTHLDVYKRQLYWLPLCHTLFMQKMEFLILWCKLSHKRKL